MRDYIFPDVVGTTAFKFGVPTLKCKIKII